MSLMLSVLAFAGQAAAAGYYFTGVGARGLGRAGANVVAADDLSAQYYNPAALSSLQGPRFNIQLAGVHQLVSFAREDESDLSFDTVQNSAPPLPIPHIGYAHPLSSRLTMAVGFVSPYAPQLRYPADGPQRFTLVDSLILSGKAGASLAWQATDHLSVGVGGAWTFLQLDQTLVSHVNPAQFQATDDANYDVSTRIQASDMAKMTGDIGLLYDRGQWAIGASASPPVSFEAEGSLVADFSQNTYYIGDGSLGKVVSDPSASDEAVSLGLVLPPVVRLGGLWRPSDDVFFEADVVWEGWSTVDLVTLTDLEMEIATTLGEPSKVEDDVIIPLSMKNALSVHMAGEGAVRPELLVRGGVFYEQSAAASGYASVLLPEGWKVGYGLGGSVQVGRGLWLDVGMGQSFVPPQDIVSSQIFQIQIDPVTGDVSRGKVVGRGTLWSLSSIASVGLNWTPGG